MRRAICPGSFDPVTNGHLDIFERASQMFDEIIISVFHNPGKDKAMFTMEERVEMLRDATKHIPNARVTCFSDLPHIQEQDHGYNRQRLPILLFQRNLGKSN